MQISAIGLMIAGRFRNRRYSDGKLSWQHRWNLVHRFGLGDRRGCHGLAGVGRRQDGKKVNKQKKGKRRWNSKTASHRQY